VKKKRSFKARKAEAFHEVKHSAPLNVMQTWIDKGPEMARKRQVAIALKKARLKK
jgi:hypothetical protein